MAAAKAIKRSKNDKIYDAVIFVILTIVFLCVAYPLYFVVISSFSNPEAVAGGEVILLPVGVNFDGYKVVFKNTEVVYGFINSVIYTIVGTAISLVVTLPTAYALSRSDFYGKKFVTIFYLITMFVSGGMVPTYLVVKNCGLLDSVWALVLPGALSAYNMIVARTFLKPVSLMNFWRQLNWTDAAIQDSFLLLCCLFQAQLLQFWYYGMVLVNGTHIFQR